jgi:hexosaminidase
MLCANSFFLLLLLLGRVDGQMPASDDTPRVWPKPIDIPDFDTTTPSLECSNSFTFSSKSVSEVLSFNIQYYRAILFARNTATTAATTTQPQSSLLSTLQIHIVQRTTPQDVPFLGMDESYVLKVQAPNATLTAPTVWGAVRGLETFVQLFRMNGDKVSILGGGMEGGFTIKDAPRFPWRGLMLDPARHFIPVHAINATLDAMAQNKLNTLHLHLTDGEAFAVNTEQWKDFTLLSVKGAFAPQVSYTKDDLRSIVAHARLRGIRVIPEFDLPAHMTSWAQGYPSLITDCPSYNPHPEWPRYYSKCLSFFWYFYFIFLRKIYG